MPQKLKLKGKSPQRFILPEKHMRIGGYLSRLKAFVQEGLMFYCDAEYVARSLPIIPLPDIVRALNLSVTLYGLSKDMCQELLRYYCSLEWIDNFGDVIDIAAVTKEHSAYKTTLMNATSYGAAYGDKFSVISATVAQCGDHWVFKGCTAVAV